MLKVNGIFKKEATREFTRKDGSRGKVRSVYIEPECDIFPIKVNVSDTDFKYKKQGDKVSIDIEIFPYYFVDGKRKRAYVDYYIPDKK